MIAPLCRAWVPINNCYLMSKEIPFSVKKTKSIFNSAMQEMEIYVENIRKKFGVFNYAPFRTPYTPNNQLQMLLDPSNPSAGAVKTEKPDKLRFNFDITASPKMVLSKTSTPSGMSRRVSTTEVPRSPMSTTSSVHTGSDGEDTEKAPRNPSFHYSTGEESMDCTGKPILVSNICMLNTDGNMKIYGCYISKSSTPQAEHNNNIFCFKYSLSCLGEDGSNGQCDC